MKYKSTAYAYLSISGKEFNIEDFINAFRITPTKIWTHRCGDKIFNYQIDATDTCEGLDRALEDLQRIFWPQAAEIKDYSTQNHLYIKLFVVIQGRKKENNGVRLGREFVVFLNDLGAEMEIAMYY